MENFRFMSSETIKLTVVQLDLVNSSKSTGVIEPELGLDGTELFINQIKEFVSEPFNSVPNRSQYDEYQSLGGDGYRILFQKVDNAYKFVENFCKYVEEYNSEPHVKKRIFRIGAVTGNVKYNPSKLGLDKITGHVLVTLSRLVTAEPGWFYVDKATFDLLNEDVRQDFIKVLVKSKEHEEDIPAWRCQMISDTSLPATEPIKLEEIYDLFKKLTQQAQITRVAQLIGMPNDFRPSNYMNLYAAKTAIVDWANEEEYRLNKLKNILIDNFR